MMMLNPPCSRSNNEVITHSANPTPLPCLKNASLSTVDYSDNYTLKKKKKKTSLKPTMEFESFKHGLPHFTLPSETLISAF